MVDITSRADSDIKPRRLVARALGNIKSLKAEGAVPLSVDRRAYHVPRLPEVSIAEGRWPH